MLRLTADEIELFKAEPVSGKVYRQLQEMFEDLMKEVALGGCLDGASMESTAINYATVVGKIQALNEILDMQPIEMDNVFEIEIKD